MNFINTLTSGLSNPLEWFADLLGGRQEAESGVVVNTKTALSYPPVWHAVNKISSDIAKMPLKVHRRVKGGSEPAKNHPAYQLLKRRPNKVMTAFTFKQTMIAHALLRGSGRAAIIRNGTKPVELIPLHPDCTETGLIDGEKWHIVTVQKDDLIAQHADSKATRYAIPDADVLHIPGLSFDGIDGLSIVEVMREAIGLGLGSQRAVSRAFRNGSRPGVVVEDVNRVLRDEQQAKEFVAQFKEAHEGVDNTGKVALLREGMKIQTLSMSARDAEWLDQRKFQRQDIAMIFSLPYIIGDEDSVSYNSLEQKILTYLSDCLMPWVKRTEEECDEKLLSPGQKARDTHFSKFNVSSLLRSDSKTEMEVNRGYIEARVKSPNEVRELLDLLPYEGGDTYANPVITPGSGDGSETEPETEDEPDTNAAENVVRDRMRHLIEVESKRVNAAANKDPVRFPDWMDRFYQGWQSRMSDAIGDDVLAEQYIEQSTNELGDVIDTATADEFAAAVERVTNQWAQRAESLAKQILSPVGV